MKTFKSEFDKLLGMLKDNKNFAFSRFSDGELFIMQNKKVVLAKDHYITGDIKGPNIYTEEEQKEFLPERDQFYREKLIECFKHTQSNYFKGIPDFKKHRTTMVTSDYSKDIFNLLLDLKSKFKDHELAC